LKRKQTTRKQKNWLFEAGIIATCLVLLGIVILVFSLLSSLSDAHKDSVGTLTESTEQAVVENHRDEARIAIYAETEDGVLVLPISAAPTEPMSLTEATEATEAETDAPPAMNVRYAELELSPEDIDLLAAITYLEAGNQSPAGQQAVVEVVLNRVIADNFPDTVHDVLYQSGQFSPAAQIAYTQPTEAQYAAVDAALYGTSILPVDVVYFSRGGENNSVWGTIGSHVFCYQYTWE
jgi:spore germination cell wall hydrolase CwlJ-like protein